MAAVLASSPIDVLDKRINRADQRSRSLALNALNRPHSSLPRSSNCNTHSSRVRRPTCSAATGKQRPGQTSASLAPARKVKHSAKKLSETLSEALQESVDELLLKKQDAPSEEESKLACEIVLSEVASTKLKRAKHSRGSIFLLQSPCIPIYVLHFVAFSDYEIICKPRVIALDDEESDLGEDWEQIDTDEEKKMEEEGSNSLSKTYAEAVAAIRQGAI